MATKPQALIEDEENRRKRLRVLIDNYYNGNASSFAARAELTRASISQLLSDGQPFGELRARSIEEKVGLPIGYFDQRDDGFSIIRGIKEIDRFYIDNILLKDSLKDIINELSALQAQGDSMSPLINDGDIVLINASVTKIVGDGIYILGVDDAYLLKRVTQTIDGTYIISSDNPNLKHTELSYATIDGLKARGKVIKVISVKNVS